MSHRNRIASKNGSCIAGQMLCCLIVIIFGTSSVALAQSQSTGADSAVTDGSRTSASEADRSGTGASGTAPLLRLQPFPNDVTVTAPALRTSQASGDVARGSSTVTAPALTTSQTSAAAARGTSATVRTSEQPRRIAQALQIPASPSGTYFRAAVQSRPARRGNIFTRMISPLIDPISGGLDTTSTNLQRTAEGINGLANPITNLAQPLTGLQQPITGLQQPLTELRQPIIDLSVPIQGLQEPINQLGDPVRSLSKSATSLSAPMAHLGSNLERLRQPLSSVAQPLNEIRAPLNGLVEPMRALPGPLNGLVAPITGLQSNLSALQQPLRGVSGSLSQLQQEVSSLRTQIEKVYDAIIDIGRNVTLAIVFGSSVIAYAIWTHRKVPSVVEPTIATIETMLAGQGNAEVGPSDHNRTIIKTEPVSHAAAHASSDAAIWNEAHPGSHKPPQAPQGTHSSGRPDDQQSPPPPPPSAFNPPGE